MRRPTLLILLAAASLWFPLAGTVVAADPSPTPSLVFPKPMQIVAIDRLEWLGDDLDHAPFMIASRDDEVSPGNYDYVDATGGFFHFYGRNLEGPYANRTDVCPFMRANGLSALGTGVWDTSTPNVTAEECAAAPPAVAVASANPPPADSPEPATATDEAVSVVEPDPADPLEGTEGEVDPIALAIAIALICLILGIGLVKVLGVVAGVGPLANRPPSLLDEGAPHDEGAPGDGSDLAAGPIVLAPPRTPQPTADQAQQTDPCAGELSALEGASAHARGLNSVLAGLRDFAAQLDQQVVLIEKAAIPAEIGVEAAFLAGGAIGGAVGPGWIPDILLGKIAEGVAKDQLKGFIKTSLANAAAQAPGAGAAARDARDEAAQATLKGMMEQAVSNHYLGESLKGYHTSASAVANSLPRKFEQADQVGGHMAEALGHLITLYNSGMSLATLVQESAILRQKLATILDDIASLEVDFEGATGRLATLAEDLQRCRWVHSPSKEPLRLGADPAP